MSCSSVSVSGNQLRVTLQDDVARSRPLIPLTNDQKMIPFETTSNLFNFADNPMCVLVREAYCVTGLEGHFQPPVVTSWLTLHLHLVHMQASCPFPPSREYPAQAIVNELLR